MDVVIRNGTLITPASVFPADVGIIGERIVALLRQSQDTMGEELEPRGAVELDATGCYVLPGGIDPHVHLQMPVGDYTSADDFTSGTVAAALGGTTTVIDFVEPEPGEPLLEALEKRCAEADGRVAVDYGLHMTIPTWHAAHGDYEKSPHTLAEVVAAGVPSFKLYLAYEGFRLDDAQLYRVMKGIAAAGGLPIIHCENGPVCETLRAQAVAQGDTFPIHHVLTRPPRQEAEAVSHAIDFAALTRSPLYVVHVSCQESMLRIQAARTRGENIYGETCPQYLLLNGMALDLPGGERLVCSPPLRTEEDNEALWGGLAFEDLDVLATDHCPFTAAEKSDHPSTGSGHHADFTTIPGGLPSIEARLSLAHHFGLRHWMTLERWVEVCCTNPARIFGLRRKGQIAPGFDADLVIFDPERWVTIQARRTLHERVDWSPYEGMHIQGWPRDVLSRGRIIVRDGEFVGQPGWGRFVSRKQLAVSTRAEANVYLEIHAEKCTGCRICENFCSFHHEGAVWPERARITIVAQSDEGPFAPTVCRQCEDAPCAAACPVGAITLNEHTGAWAVDVEECIGCGDCVEACPYETIFLDEERGVSLKCDLCGGEPECAAMCPTGAIALIT